MRKLLALPFSGTHTAISIVVLSLITSSLTFTPANAAPNSIEVISIAEASCTSVEIIFKSSIPKKSPVYYVISAAVDRSVGHPKNIKKVFKTKASGLITAEIENLNPKVAYKFSVSAKAKNGKMINSKPVEYFSMCDLMDVLSNLPADWGNPKPTTAPIAGPFASQATLSITSLTTNTKVYPYSQALSITSSGGSGSGATTYAIAPGGSASGCTLAGPTATETITATTSGTCLIQASKAADSIYSLATSATSTFTFTKATPILSNSMSWFDTLLGKTSDSVPFDLGDPTVADNLAGTFTFVSANLAVATIFGKTVTIVRGGNAAISATFTPTDTTNYNIATKTMTLIVTQILGGIGGVEQ
jgi:hypothetical protein